MKPSTPPVLDPQAADQLTKVDPDPAPRIKSSPQPAAPKIASPFGYGRVEPLARSHRVRLPLPGQIPDFAKHVNAVPIALVELTIIARAMPVVFLNDGRGSYSCVAVLGMADGENLFLEQDNWLPGLYMPAYLRRWPFCMTRLVIDNVEHTKRLVCIDMNAVHPDGVTLVDSNGNDTARWTEIQTLLNEFEAQLEAAREMNSLLAEWGLIEPFTAQATFNSGGTANLQGMFRVDPKALEQLPADRLKKLQNKGYLSLIYAHLHSLDLFGELLERKSQRDVLNPLPQPSLPPQI